MGLVDLTNQKFGRLTVLCRDKEKEKQHIDRHAMWRCKCDCGNEVSVVGKDLRQGKTQSCGCLQKEKTAEATQGKLLGMRFGKLIVIKQLPSKNSRTYWLCQCDCGNIVEVCGRELTKGDTKSCGCIRSIGAATIETILQQFNISYQKEYSFEDLKYIRPLRFDFAIFNKKGNLFCLIEYDGQQHFTTTGGWNTKDQVKITQERDNIKNNYCKKHQIPLIRISYTDKVDAKYLIERITQCQNMLDISVK